MGISKIHLNVVIPSPADLQKLTCYFCYCLQIQHQMLIECVFLRLLLFYIMCFILLLSQSAMNMVTSQILDF